MRQSNTGGVMGRVYNLNGDVVPGASVYSIFNEYEKVQSALDGSFHLPELPAGRNNLVISHKSYRVRQEYVDIIANKVTELENIRLDWATAAQWISDFKLYSISSSSAVFSWKTQKPAVCNLKYGTDQSYGNIISEEKAESLHEVAIKGLESEKLYHARAEVTDENGVIWYSYDLSFKTEPDIYPEPPKKVWLSPLSSFGTIQVNWESSPSALTVKGYRVYRQEKGKDWTQIAAEGLDQYSAFFPDQHAEGGKFYRYGVRAATGDGALSDICMTETIFMPGFITQSITVTASDSPVDLFSDIVIGPGIYLNVEPGVEFRIASVDAFRLGFDTERIEILVQGKISLLGNQSAPVKFVPMEIGGQRGLWNGIKIQNGNTGNSEITYAEISCCREWAIEAENCDPSITNLTVKFCGGGIRLNGVRNSPEFKDIKIDDVSLTAIEANNCRRPAFSGIEILRSGTGIKTLTDNAEDRITIQETRIEARDIGIYGKLNRSVFSNLLILVPDGIGVYYERASATENILDHCTIDASIGIIIGTGTPTIENNIIIKLSEDGAAGIKYMQTGIPQFKYNNLYGFALAYDGCAAGEGATTFRPDFTGGNPYSYTLPISSPLKRCDRNGLETGRYGDSYY
ncbi:MAG: right-handed parallel beta-helix repeat-containing protein [Candidatus Riflebacteria bacterium]|nr:right-handed parallel beta-helix repeat-containing protein [Candidatus Riflebacteria bacterium]